MTDDAALRVAIADVAPRGAGWLYAGEHADADIPFGLCDDLPFVDRAVQEIAVGAAAHSLTRAALLRLLHECRRVLRGGGTLQIATAPSAASDATLDGLAHLAGLTRIVPAIAGDMTFAKPLRLARGDPLVTIAIPAYSPRYFGAALDSAIAQTYANLEIVICDDSPDEAIDSIVRQRRSRHPIRYQRNPVRLGVRANYVQCFELARGEFVKFLCDDDLLAPGCVSAFVDAFRRVPDLTLATSRRLRIDAAGARLPDQPATLPIVDTDTVIAGVTLANAMLMAGLNMIGEPSTVLFRKADLDDAASALFNFDGARGHGVIDMVMWSALLAKGDAVYLHEPRSAFRVHAAQRQHDPAKQERNVTSIRELQAAWQILALDRRVPPDLLLTKGYPPTDDEDWVTTPVRSFVLRPVPVPSPHPFSAGMIDASRTETRAGDESKQIVQIEPERARDHGEETRKQ